MTLFRTLASWPGRSAGMAVNAASACAALAGVGVAAYCVVVLLQLLMEVVRVTAFLCAVLAFVVQLKNSEARSLTVARRLLCDWAAVAWRWVQPQPARELLVEPPAWAVHLREQVQDYLRRNYQGHHEDPAPPAPEPVVLREWPASRPAGLRARGDGDDRPVPAEFLCPIEQEVMRRPTVLSSGVTYEYEAIRRWMADALARGEAPTCPVTRHPVSPQVLAPNLAMHQAIAAWLADGSGSGVPTRRRSPRVRKPTQT